MGATSSSPSPSSSLALNGLLKGFVQTSSSSHSQIEGQRVDTSKDPDFYHEIDEGDFQCWSNSSQYEIDNVLSSLRVSTSAADELQRDIQREYFTEWEESNKVREFTGFHLSQLNELIDGIEEEIRPTGQSLRQKLEGIRFAGEWKSKVIEFCFKNNLESGNVYFGAVALTRDKNTNIINAMTCIYNLSFEVAQERVTTTTDTFYLGTPIGSKTSTSYRSRQLKVSPESLQNFCRVKALRAFWKKGFVSAINDS